MRPWEIRPGINDFDFKKNRVFSTGSRYFYAQDKQQLGKKELREVRKLIS